MTDPTLLGAQQFMTVDAFDVQLAEGPDSAVVSKDHSGPMSPQGRTTAEHARAITREIEWLTAASHIRGVVNLASSSGEGQTVRTVFGGGPTLRSDCPDEAGTAVVLIDICRTLTALTDAGLIHGSLHPEHIIIRPDLSTVLCSPNTSDQPSGDLQSLGRCIEFATEQWATPSNRIEQWLVLAKRLRDGDPTLSPERVAHQLESLSMSPKTAERPRVGRLIIGAVALLAAATGALLAMANSPAPRVSGPEVEVNGLVVQVGQQGQIALARPADSCGAARVYLLDPVTFRIWTFEDLRSGHAGTALAMVPGATELQLLTEGACTAVLATGPTGSVALD